MTRILFRILSEAKSAAVSTPETVPEVNTDLVVIIAALLCALICVLGLVAVTRCAWISRFRGGIGGGASAARPNPPPVAAANKGLKKKVLQSLPKLVYSDESTAAAARFVDCAICLAEFAAGEEIKILPQCGHGFHVLCIDTWLGSHSSCPSCRRILIVARCHKCGGLPSSSRLKPEPEPATRFKECEDLPHNFLP